MTPTYKSKIETDLANYKRSGMKNIKSIGCFALLTGIHSALPAQEKVVQEASASVFSNPLFLTLLGIAIILLVVIKSFASVVIAATQFRSEQEKAKNNKANSGVGILLALISLSLIGNFSYAQTVSEPVIQTTSSDFAGLDSTVFYLMLLFIVVELLVVWSLYSASLQLLGVQERKLAEAEEQALSPVKQPTLIDKLNASVSLEKEADIMLDHDYDGIKELDNNLPPWWKYGFYLTIVVGVVYLFHYHVLHTGNLQIAEYQEQIEQGKKDVEDYKKNAANLVDENTVTLLTDKESLLKGQTLFISNCVACHGQLGEGNAVGPNLTDDFWIHKGGIKDIFISIEYGWPEKGMKSWKQDLGGRQIQEVASYIKSLRGSNPAGAKEKQGELYLDEGASALSVDSTAIKDSSTTMK
jgi:cytochrome c oxidase cbb3-type subunit 3